jgi:RNA polymerase sigma-70 factor, ECF subfamily
MFGFGRKQNWEDFEREAMPYMKDVYRVAYWLTRNQTEAEDLTQETLSQALKSFHNYEIGTNCKAWMMTIMYHTNSRRLRKMNRLQLVNDTEERIAETIAFEPSIPQNLTDVDVIAALKRVPKNFAEVVVLADVEGFAYKEVSAILNIPIGTVMSRLSRGRKVLRIELAEYARNYGFDVDEKAGGM